MKQSGLFINEARKLSKRDRKRIDDILKQLLPDVDRDCVLADIESATQIYWAALEAEQQRQKPAEIARELSRVAKCATALRAAIRSLGKDADEELNYRMLNRHVPRTTYLSLNDLESRLGGLVLAANSFKPSGRPKERAMRDFVFDLAEIHERATGVWLKLRNSPYRTDAENRITFFECCLQAAGAGYPSGIIKRVLESRSVMDKTPR
jgi:hypothetical protein